MQNLEQIRARNAFAYSRDDSAAKGGQDGGEVIKKIPPMILNHGFLATAAYGMDQKQRAWGAAFTAIARHLSDPDIRHLPDGCDNLEKMLRHLTRHEATSAELKIVTGEAMAWLNYARRFVQRN